MLFGGPVISSQGSRSSNSGRSNQVPEVPEELARGEQCAVLHEDSLMAWLFVQLHAGCDSRIGLKGAGRVAQRPRHGSWLLCDTLQAGRTAFGMLQAAQCTWAGASTRKVALGVLCHIVCAVWCKWVWTYPVPCNLTGSFCE